MDKMTEKQRSYCMSRVRGKNTSIEILFRKMLSAAGIRGYRIRGKVAGSPDVYFPRLKFAVFIDGCFWHKCPRCFKKPKSNLAYWDKKIRDNVTRDRRVDNSLRAEGIKYMRIWEHDVRLNQDSVMRRFLKRYTIALDRAARIR
jgi:DNA mismatch endonuclease, patch repair protein